MFTSTSEVFTPAELSIASVFSRTPWRAASIRARWVMPRFAPSPTTFARIAAPVILTASFARSPASASVSDEART